MNSELRSQMVSLKSQIATLKESYDQVTDELEMEQLRSHLQGNVGAQPLGSQAITAQIEAEVGNRTRELEQMVAQTSSEKDALLQQREVIRAEMRRLTDKVVEADREKATLHQQVTSLEEVVCQMQDKLTAAEQEQIRIASGAETLKAEKKVLEDEIADLKSIQRSLLKQRELITDEVGRLTNIIVVSQNDRAELDARIASISKEKNHLGDRVLAAERETQQLREELTEAQKREAEQAKLLEQRDIFQKEVKRLTDQVVAVTTEKTALWEKVNTLEGMVSDLDEKAQAALRGQKQLIEEKIALLSNENSVLLQQRAAISAEVSRIQQEIDASEEDQSFDQLSPGVAFEDAPATRVRETVDVENRSKSMELSEQTPAEKDDIGQDEISPEEFAALDLKNVDLKTDSPDAVKRWLAGRRLEQYFPIFVEQGYDALIILMNADSEELAHLIDMCDMPKGRAKQLLRGVQALQTLRPEGGAAQQDVGGEQDMAAA